MNTSIQIFEYEGHQIEFDMGQENLLVNATEMNKIFGRRINDFLENDGTKRFIHACLNNGISRYLGIEKQDDLYTTRQRTGTWMHRILALKFAAWLDPNFEIWVYTTVDKIINTTRSELRAQAKLDAELAILKADKYESDPEYRMIVDKEEESKHYKKTRRSTYLQQYLNFRNAVEFEGNE